MERRRMNKMERRRGMNTVERRRMNMMERRRRMHTRIHEMERRME